MIELFFAFFKEGNTNTKGLSSRNDLKWKALFNVRKLFTVSVFYVLSYFKEVSAMGKLLGTSFKSIF